MEFHGKYNMSHQLIARSLANFTTSPLMADLETLICYSKCLLMFTRLEVNKQVGNLRQTGKI